MKKWLILTLLSIVLVACSNDEPASPAKTSTSDKVEQTTEKKLTEENAMKIAENIHNSFIDTWINMEKVLAVDFEDEYYGMFAPDKHYEQYTSRLSSFATDNYVDADYIEMIKEMCFACDALPYSLSLDLADEHTVSIINDKSFTLKSHYPVSLYFHEANVTKSYVFVDGTWKIDDEEYEILQQADGVTDYETTYVEQTANAQLEKMYAQGLALKESYENVSMDGSMVDMTTDKLEIATKFSDYLNSFDQLVLTVDPYYEINQKVWAQLLKDAIKHTEDETTGGSGQGLFMVETEVEFSIDRMETLYERYTPYFQ